MSLPFDPLSLSALMAAVIALLAGSVHGYSGFGGALMMVPLLSFFAAPVHAVALTMIAAFFGQASMVLRAVRIARWQECGPFLVASIAAAPLGAFLLVGGDAGIVRRLVGMTTLIAACILATGWAYRGARTPAVGALFGTLSGLVNGATGQGGPVSVAYFIAAPVGAEMQRANIISTVCGLVIGTLLSLAANGVLGVRLIAVGAALGLPYMLGITIGSRMFQLLPKQSYRRATLGLLFLTGIAALIK
ncbi:MAG: sulfite exporter TauE/SafE family protein [Hyphomicrobiaceae bacterium]|nr:sulfite exporter TauE/SafE family protein [Hyphomicrobiaceae bacterium]